MPTLSQALAAIDNSRNALTAHHVRQIGVFGSVARGDAGPQSDVDFLVRFQDGRSLLDHGGLLMDLQDLLSCEVDDSSKQVLHVS